MTARTALALLAVNVAVAAATPANAGDGVYEIHPSCVATGCGPPESDGPGLPVTLKAGASYRLTADLSVPTVNDAAIHASSGSTLDLGGFSLLGPVVCSGTPTVCNPSGNGSGAFGVQAAGGATIRNGRIAGFGSHGINSTGDGVRIENVVLSQNFGHGVYMQGSGSQIAGCTALRNGGDGFFLGVASNNANLVTRSTAHANGGDGFDVVGALVLDVAAHDNAGLGMRANYPNHRNAVGRSVFGYNDGGPAGDQAEIDVAIGANVCGAAVCP